MMRRNAVKKMSLITMLTAMAILIHSVEPNMPIPIPGVKFGLANAIALVALFLFNFKVMLRINIIRVLISSLIRGIFLGIGFWMSFSGMLLSSLLMLLAKRFTKMSAIGVSLAGAYGHNIGQIIALIVINNTWGMIYWLPFMLFSSIPTGLITGYLTKLILTRLTSIVKGD